MYSTGRWCSPWEHTGVIASTIINARPFRKKTARVVKAKEFIPPFERRKQSDREIENVFRQYTMVHNQAIRNRRRKANGKNR